MARSLSWIDAAEWSALLGDVQPRREHDDSGIDNLRDSLHGFEARRPARPARAARPASYSPAQPSPRFEDNEPVKATPATRRRPQEAPLRPAPRAAAPARKPIAQAAPPASAATRLPAVTKPEPAEPAQPTAPEQTPSPRIQESAAPAPAPAPAAEVIKGVPAVEPFQLSAGTEPLEYLDEYLEWLIAQARLDGAVIADTNGLAIAERHTGEIDAAVSGSIDMLLHHLGTVLAFDSGAGADSIGGHVALQHNGRHIIVIWAPTDYGRLYGVLVGEIAPAPEVLAMAAETLRSLFAS